MNICISLISHPILILVEGIGWHCVDLAESPVNVEGPGYPPCAVFLGPEIVTINKVTHQVNKFFLDNFF